MTAASPQRPLMISVPVSPYVELARWVLERLSVDYVEQRHAPVFNTLAARRHRGGTVVPVLNIGARSLTDARQIVDHYDASAPPHLRLFPSSPTQNSEARALFDKLYDGLGVAVRAWAYAYQLPVRSVTTRAWIAGAPLHERLIVPVVYPLIAKRVGRGLGLHPGSIPEQRALIDASLDRLDARLADGRRYLLGDALTAPDLALATMLAPVVVPPEYAGPLPGFDESPAPMQREMTELRDRPAAQLALRIFREERGSGVSRTHGGTSGAAPRVRGHDHP